MKKINNHYNFLIIGKTQETTDNAGFKRYVGLGSTFVKGVQPTKAQIDEFFGYESPAEPEYVKDTDNGKEVLITFLLQTDPALCNGIELKTRVIFTLRQAPAYNKDRTSVQIIDRFGNSKWVPTEVAEKKEPLSPKAMIDQQNYRIACAGECDLVAFLKKYLGVPDALSYVNGAWVLSEKADDGKFGLENIKDYFKGDFSELQQALAYQPDNKVKLLYGVRTKDGKQYQAVCTKGDLILRNNAGTKAIAKLTQDLISAKSAGSFASIDYRVQELQEYTVTPTNLEEPPAEPAGFAAFDGDTPW